MPVLSITLLPGGAFLDVGVGASQRFTGPTNRPDTRKALIDTGADMTVVSPHVVTALRPQRMSSVRYSGIGGGTVWLPTYDVRVRFGGHAGPGRWFAIEAVEVQPATPDVDVLIGMDLLLRIDLAWFGQQRRIEMTH